MKFRPLFISVYLLLSVVFCAYLTTPLSSFPEIPPGSIKSSEPGDNETPLRRAYYTNMDREGAIEYVKSNMQNSFLGILVPTLRLNYPPEEAGTIIRDQTKSSYLEEITLPFRESFYINGFIAKEEKDAMIVEGKRWNQKITIKHVVSPVWARLLVGILTITIIPFVVINTISVISSIKNKNQ